MTITAEQKQAVERAGEAPVRVEDPETRTAYLIVREDIYRRMWQSLAIDHSDRSLYEVGEFRPYPRGRGAPMSGVAGSLRGWVGLGVPPP